MASGKNDEKKSDEKSGKEIAIVSRYFLHPSDNPGMLIKPIQLK